MYIISDIRGFFIYYINLLKASLFFDNSLEIFMGFILRSKPVTLIKDNVVLYFPNNELKTVFNVVSILKKGVYTNDFVDIDEGDLVVDIGANIGAFSFLAATKGASHVYCFEPGKEAYANLTRSLQKMKLGNVTLFNSCVSDVDGYLSFFISKSSTRNSLYSNDVFGMETPEYIHVPSITLPQFMEKNELRHIDYLKMDCEGSEGSILSSLPDAYFKNTRKIALEFHDNSSSLNHEKIIHLLESHEFETMLEWDGKQAIGMIYARRND